ncbi:MAG: PD-(D/E)XK nuclease family protein [Thermoplasmata archaeon]
MGDHITLSLQRSLSIDEIYHKVKDHDLVLTVDAPLADALNARLTAPHLGPFATTPRRLALNSVPAEKKFNDKRELFVEIVDQTDLEWKEASYLFENIVECWMETGEPDEVMKHDRYDSEDVKKIVNLLKNTINPYSAPERYTVPPKVKLAVIAPHQFTQLDKKVLPDRYDTVKPFEDSTTTLPEFNVFNSTTEITQTVLEHVKKLGPKDVAIVMEKDSDYRYLLESQFRSQKIPHMVSRDITESEGVRKFLNLIRLSFYRRGAKIKDIRSLAKEKIRPKEEEYFIHSFQDPVTDLIDDIPQKTFRELINDDYFEEGLDELQEQLKAIDIIDEKITLQRLNSLTYYLETFDIQVESASQGVLIASPSTSTYIDRPIVFYLGMDSSWTPEVPSKPWVDEKKYDERKIKDFKILLQNGQRRYFLVKNKELNQNMTPSFYFNEFTDETIESFTDLKHELRHRPLKERRSPFQKEKIETEQEETKMLSQSVLNTLAHCPKDRFFDELTERPDKIYFRRGTVFHDLAEFLIDHPEMKDEEEKIIQKMSEELSPFMEEHQMDIMKTKFRVGLENLVDFLEKQEPELEEPEGYEKKHADNIFAESFGEPINTEFTEVSFYDEEIGAKGKVDFVQAPDHLIDHKTGSKKSIYAVMRRSDTEEIHERPDFQAKMYLAHHRRYYPNEKIDFTYYHLLDNERDVVSGEGDYSDNIVTIQYHPREFNDMVHEEGMFEWLKSSNNRKKVLNKLKYKNYRSFFEDRDIPDLEKDELLDHDVTKEFINHCREKIGSYKYVKKACRSIMKKFVRFRETRYFKSDIDRFEGFLQEQIELYNEYRSTSFPVKDIDPDEIENKDLVIV